MEVNRVIVVGGSMAGLATAAALSRVVDEVVVVERSEPEGTTAPQAALPHILVAAGNRVLEELFPGFAQSLLDLGAEPAGDDPRRFPAYWPAAGAVRHELILDDPGFPRALCGRRLIEPELRRRVLALSNVTFVHGVADDVLCRDGRVVGVVVRDSDPLRGDLVVDATGRGGGFRAGLARHGFAEPATTEVGVDLRYTGYFVERRAGDLDGAAVAVVQNTRKVSRIGVALPLDRGRWQIAFGGYFGDVPPADQTGAVTFARSLADPVLAPLLERPFLEEPHRYRFRSSIRRHWERANLTPGLVAIGDSVASFNPIYGQGMSSALLQAGAAAEVIARHGLAPGLERRIAHATAKVVDSPWLVATGGDFTYPATVGHRPRGHRVVGAYLERVMRVAAHDNRVNLALTSVQQMTAPPQALFAPAVMARVLRPSRPGESRRAASASPAPA